MRILVVILALVGLVTADIGIGYHYKPPSSSYGVPVQTGSEQSSGFSSGSSSQASHGSNYALNQETGYQQNLQVQAAPAYTTSQTGYQSGSEYSQQYPQQFSHGYQSGFGLNAQHSGNEYHAGTGYQQQASSGYHADSSYHSGSGSQNTVGHAHSHYKASSSVSSGLAPPRSQSSGSLSTVQGSLQKPSASEYQSAFAQQYQDYYKQQQQPTQVFKHFYVHAAPEEPEQPKFRQPPVLPAPQKHYKIIFIKTPTPAPAVPQFIPIQQQNEEKTIVYVLVKKPEEAKDIILPKIEQKPPTKPEVFFIKYNDKEDSQQVINNIVNDYNNKGQDGTVSFSGVSASEAGNSKVTAGQSYNQAVQDNRQSVGLSSSDSTLSSSATVIEGQTASNVASSVESSAASANYDSGHVSSQFQSGVSQSGYTGGEVQADAQVSQASSHNTGDVQTLSQGGTIGEVQSQQNYNSITTSQGVPHETYGAPKFRLN